MAWTTPRTWVTRELVTAAIMNAHVRDNLLALKAPPSQTILRNNAGSYMTTSGTFVVVDTTNLKCTLTTNGGDVLVIFSGVVTHSVVNTLINFDIRYDGTTLVGAAYTAGLLSVSTANVNTRVPVTVVALIAGLAAGSHTFELMWSTGVATASLLSNTTTVPATLIAREVS